jgi:hypothetical protein
VGQLLGEFYDRCDTLDQAVVGKSKKKSRGK